MSDYEEDWSGLIQDHAKEMRRRDAEIERLTAEKEKLRAALAGLRWKSVDRDNMEFECRVTCYEKDELNLLVQQETVRSTVPRVKI